MRVFWLVSGSLTMRRWLSGVPRGYFSTFHSQALRWYCLFVGVMKSVTSSLTCRSSDLSQCFLRCLWVESVWLQFHIKFFAGDIADDKFFRKVNDSDCTQFHIMFPRISTHCKSALPSMADYLNECNSLGVRMADVWSWSLHIIPLHRVSLVQGMRKPSNHWYLDFDFCTADHAADECPSG